MDVTEIIDTSGTDEIVETFSTVTGSMSWNKWVYTILLLAICLVVIKVLLTILERSLTQFNVDKSLHTFIKSSVKILLWLITLMVVAGSVGIEMSSLIAVLGVAGLALSLAIQSSLSNLAGGIMVLVSKPFAVTDWIEAGGVTGIVEDIGLVYTKIKTFDNKIIFVPNGEISEEKIINYTSQTERRVDMAFEIAYESDPKVAKQCILDVIGKHNLALFTPEPYVRVTAYQESSVKITVRVWCATADYWTLHDDLMEQVRESFDQHQIEITYNHLNVHILDK